MRRAARTDANQPEIVQAYRDLGFSVQPLHAVGQGVPDLLIARTGLNYLVEVKDGEKVPSDRKLTKPQKAWHAAWNAPVYVINSVDDVIQMEASL